MGEVLQGKLEVPRVHVPQTLHEDLVTIGDACEGGEGLGLALAVAVPPIDVEQEVVEYRELVVECDVVGIAEVLVQLAQSILILGRVIFRGYGPQVSWYV